MMNDFVTSLSTSISNVKTEQSQLVKYLFQVNIYYFKYYKCNEKTCDRVLAVGRVRKCWNE